MPVEPVEVAERRVIRVEPRWVGHIAYELLDDGAISRPPRAGIVAQHGARVYEGAVVVVVVVVVRVAVVAQVTLEKQVKEVG